jgi:hypothetical protein
VTYVRLDLSENEDETTVLMDLARGSVSVKQDRDATVVQVGKVQMAVSRTGVRVVSREGPATGHARCHEVEMFTGIVP